MRPYRNNPLGCRFRITNAHRAAVCALVLIGQSFREACAITGAPEKSMREMINPDWRERVKRPRKWKGALLEEIKEAYHTPGWALKRISELYGISSPNLCKLAIEHGWPQRIRIAQPLPVLTKRQIRDYLKMKHAGLPRSEALRAVGA